MNIFLKIFFFIIGLPLLSQGQIEVNSVRHQLNKTNPLYGYLVGPGTEKLNKPVLRPFATDGCSLSPNDILEYDFVECCVQHDVAYWLGGTEEQKMASDKELYACISQKATPIIAQTYLEAVSVGGAAGAPNTFRWGYGWDQIRPYGPISAIEMKQAERLYGPNLQKLHTMIAEKKYVINLELITLDFVGINRFRADKLVYYFLQNTLKRNDIVSSSTKMYWHPVANSWFYRIRLQSCGNKDIFIKLRRTQAWLDAMLAGIDIDKAPWSTLKIYIEDVQDPGHCLK